MATLDKLAKKRFMGQTMYMFSKAGMYNCFMPYMLKSNTSAYLHNFQMPQPSEFPMVEITAEYTLDIAKEYVLKGNNPIVLNLVTKQFDGTNIEACAGIKDENINYRTNFFQTINAMSLYPLPDGRVVYSPRIFLVRDGSLGWELPANVKHIAMITASVINDPPLVDENMMDEDSYIKTAHTIEAVFQTAYYYHHDILILNDFGCRDDKLPISDIIDIYNGALLKYGHLFKQIIFSIDCRRYEGVTIFTEFNKGIYKLHELLTVNMPVENVHVNYSQETHMPTQQIIVPNDIPNQILVQNNNIPNNMLVQNNNIPNQILAQNNNIPNNINPSNVIFAKPSNVIFSNNSILGK
jgi:hypothetical protein